MPGNPRPWTRTATICAWKRHTDLFLRLTTFSAEGSIVPGAAEGWTVSGDGLTWTFTLRPRLAWSDGTALTADDFVFSFRRLLAPQTAASLAYFMYPLKNAAAVNAGRLPADSLGVRADGPRTLTITLEEPYPYLPERLLYPTAYPVPRHVIQEVGDDWVKPDHWVSNGAYRLTDWQPQAAVTLERSPHFAASGLPPAHIERVTYHPLAGEQAAYNRYRAGEVHAINSFPAGELPRVRASMAEDLRLSPLLSIVYLVFNTRQAPFDDARVREALGRRPADSHRQGAAGRSPPQPELRPDSGQQLRAGSGARRGPGSGRAQRASPATAG